MNRLVPPACRLLIGLTACASPCLAGDWLVSPEACKAAGLSAYWQLRLPLLPGELVDGVYPQDQQVYVTTNMGVLTAVAADTGLVRWVKSLAQHGSQIYRPINVGADPQDGFVLVTTAVAKVLLLDQLAGSVLLELPLRLPPSGPAVTDGSRIYVGGNNGWLHAINLRDGALEWRTAGNMDDRAYRWPGSRGHNWTTMEFPAPLHVWGGDWSISLISAIPSPPAVVGDILYFPTTDGHIYCCRTADKRELWSRQLPGKVYGPIVATTRGVYVACTDNSLYCLGPDNGQLLWRDRTAGPCVAGPTLTSDTLYQLSEGAGLYAIDPTSGMLRWQLAEGTRFLAQNDGLAYVLADGNLVVMDAAAGTPKHRVPLPEVVLPATNAGGAAVYLCSEDGRLLCIQPANVPYLRVGQVRREMRRPSAEDQALDREIDAIAETASTPSEGGSP